MFKIPKGLLFSTALCATVAIIQWCVQCDHIFVTLLAACIALTFLRFRLLRSLEKWEIFATLPKSIDKPFKTLNKQPNKSDSLGVSVNKTTTIIKNVMRTFIGGRTWGTKSLPKARALGRRPYINFNP